MWKKTVILKLGWLKVIPVTKGCYDSRDVDTSAVSQGLSPTQGLVLTLILTGGLTGSYTLPPFPESHSLYLLNEGIGLRTLLKAGVPCFPKYFRVVT